MPVPGVRWGTSGHRSEVGPLQSQRVQHEEVVEVACRQQSKATVRLAASVSLPQGIAADLSSSCKTADRVACFTTACIRQTYRWNDYGVRRATSRLCNWHASCAANIGLFETRKWTYWS